jgi:hypothetical protein
MLEDPNLGQLPLESLSEVFGVLGEDADLPGVGPDEQMPFVPRVINGADRTRDGAVDLSVLCLLGDTVQDSLETSAGTIACEFKRVNLTEERGQERDRETEREVLTQRNTTRQLSPPVIKTCPSSEGAKA